MCATRSSLRSRFLTHGDRNTRSRLRTLLERVRRTNRHRRAYRQLLARTGALSCTKEPPRARPEQSSVQSSRERSRSVSMLHRNESPNVYRAADRATPAANALQSRTWSPFNAMAWFGDPPCSVRQALLVLYWAGEDANCGGEDSQTDDRDRIAAEVARVRRDEGHRSRDARHRRLSRLLHHRRWRNRTRHQSRGCCVTACTTLQRHRTASSEVLMVRVGGAEYARSEAHCARWAKAAGSAQVQGHGRGVQCSLPRSGTPVCTKQLATASAPPMSRREMRDMTTAAREAIFCRSGVRRARESLQQEPDRTSVDLARNNFMGLARPVTVTAVTLH